ncbi:MAG: DUF3667 domain-containing protein [Gammaproteobacteria bacterium]|nr:DUF3667 domain-containing protein [Gammaproteobacteria bacterium]
MSSPATAEPAPPAGAAVAAPPAAAAQPSVIGATPCANCGALLAGRYCSECGQRHHDQPVHHFWHFISEAIEDLTHADSRLWQTLIALLFRPGFLTREFLEGRRVRYLPPLRLYLVVSVIFFVIVGLDARTVRSYVVVSYNGKSFNYKVVPAPDATKPGVVTHSPARTVSGSGSDITAIAPTAAARQRLCAQSATFVEQHAGWLARFGPRMAQSCLTALAQGGVERFNQIVEHNLERAMFLFLPLLALMMKPLYLRPPRHYVEHLLFFLHSHAFLFVMLGLSTLLGMTTSSGVVLDLIDTAIAVYVPIYFYLAMRRVYGQGVWLTLGKLTALGAAYFVLGAVMIAATASYSFLTL